MKPSNWLSVLLVASVVTWTVGCGGDGEKGKNDGDSGSDSGHAAHDSGTDPQGDEPSDDEPNAIDPKDQEPPDADPMGTDPRDTEPGDSAAASSDLLDPNLPDYTAVPGVSGTIKSEGSDTMNNLMALWGEGFNEFYPDVKLEVVGKGSSTAVPALIAGTANFGPMSRAAKAEEIDEFEEKYGYKPTQLGTSLDMLAVYVNKDNPVEQLTLPQVDAIFSQNRKLGLEQDIAKWGDVGVTEFADQPISMYGRNSSSGTYGFFKKISLGDGDYKTSVKEQPGTSAVVQGVGSDKYAIGYSGIGGITPDVRAVPLATSADAKAFAPVADNADDYPLTRFLLLTVNYKPNSELPPLHREFLRYVFSKQGQEDVLKDGYLPVPAEIAAEELARVGIEVE